MRISCDPNDPGYDEWKALSGLATRVYLDGVEMRNVITADEEAGMIVRYKSHMGGGLIMDRGVVLRETLYGLVELH